MDDILLIRDYRIAAGRLALVLTGEVDDDFEAVEKKVLEIEEEMLRRMKK